MRSQRRRFSGAGEAGADGAVHRRDERQRGIGEPTILREDWHKASDKPLVRRRANPSGACGSQCWAVLGGAALVAVLACSRISEIACPQIVLVVPILPCISYGNKDGTQ